MMSSKRSNLESYNTRNRYISVAILFFISIFCLVSLLSYHASDNCINVANSNPVKNLGGQYGAIVSDMLLQAVGLASGMLVITTVIWTCIMIMGHKISFFWFRIPIMFVSVISVAILLASFGKYNFAMQMLPGGYIGYFLFNFFSQKIHWGFVVIGSLVTSLFSCYFSILLERKVFQMVSKIIGNMALNQFNFLKYICNFVLSIVTLRFAINIIRDRGKIVIVMKEMFKKTSKSQVLNKEVKKQQDKLDLTNKRHIKLVHESDLRTKKAEYLAPSSELLYKPELQTAPVLRAMNSAHRVDQLTKVLNEFGVKGRIINHHCGPVVTLFELQLQSGIKSSRVIGLTSDIARTMESMSTRIATIPGKDTIGIELPNDKRQKVVLRQLVESAGYTNANAAIPIILGQNIMGNPVVVDLTKMPHLLVAGTTGSGKSVGVNCMILSVLYKLSPNECKFIMIDPKMLELSLYDGIPHLLAPVITDSKKAILSLQWVVAEMDRRYRLMSKLGIRNITNYNDKVLIAESRGGQLVREIDVGYNSETGEIIKETVAVDAKYMPYIVVIIDEMADLMLVAGKEIEVLVQRLAQMARAAGIHLITATQRPSVDVITGVIKANFPTRISYQVTSKIDSRTILGEQGAEQLLGQGDMLYMASGGKITRVHGPFVSEDEISSIVAYLKTQYRSDYIDITVPHHDNDENASDLSYDPNQSVDTSNDNMLYQQAIRIVMQEKRTSISYIQRKLRIGYNKAANLIEKMEEDGILSAPDNTGKRMILQDT